MKQNVMILIAVLLSIGTMATAQNTTRTLKLNGIEMVETMSNDGMSMVRVPYRWFAGMAEADVESVAAEMAQLEAYAAISRVIENIVTTHAKRGTIVNNGKVQQALKSHWEQMSMSIQQACEPFGDAESVYNPETKMYQVTAKVGIRGDRYVKMLDGAKDAKPEGLSGNDLKEFIDANDAIIDAARGN